MGAVVRTGRLSPDVPAPPGVSSPAAHKAPSGPPRSQGECGTRAAEREQRPLEAAPCRPGLAGVASALQGGRPGREFASRPGRSFLSGLAGQAAGVVNDAVGVLEIPTAKRRASVDPRLANALHRAQLLVPRYHQPVERQVVAARLDVAVYDIERPGGVSNSTIEPFCSSSRAQCMRPAFISRSGHRPFPTVPDTSRAGASMRSPLRRLRSRPRLPSFRARPAGWPR